MNLKCAEKIDGWMKKEELQWIAEKAENCLEIVEVGSYKGRSTRAWCDNTRGTVYAVDPWSGNYYQDNGVILFPLTMQVFAEFLENTQDCDNLVAFRGTLEEFAKLFKAKPDLVFIDGDHRYDYVKKDIEIGFELLKPNGILAGHDYTHIDWPGVRRAVDDSFNNINLMESIWWIQK